MILVHIQKMYVQYIYKISRSLEFQITAAVFFFPKGLARALSESAFQSATLT